MHCSQGRLCTKDNDLAHCADSKAQFQLVELHSPQSLDYNLRGFIDRPRCFLMSKEKTFFIIIMIIQDD